MHFAFLDRIATEYSTAGSGVRLFIPLPLNPDFNPYPKPYPNTYPNPYPNPYPNSYPNPYPNPYLNPYMYLNTSFYSPPLTRAGSKKF